MNGISFGGDIFWIFGFNKIKTSIFYFSAVFSLLHCRW